MRKTNELHGRTDRQPNKCITQPRVNPMAKNPKLPMLALASCVTRSPLTVAWQRCECSVCLNATPDNNVRACLPRDLQHTMTQLHMHTHGRCSSHWSYQWRLWKVRKSLVSSQQQQQAFGKTQHIFTAHTCARVVFMCECVSCEFQLTAAKCSSDLRICFILVFQIFMCVCVCVVSLCMF